MKNFEMTKMLSRTLGYVEALHSLCDDPAHLCLIEQIHERIENMICDCKEECQHEWKPLEGSFLFSGYFCTKCGVHRSI